MSAVIALRRRSASSACPSDDAKLARLKADFGSDVTINYVKQDFVEAIKAETGGKGVDLVIESIAGRNLARSIASLKYRGRAIMVGVSGRDQERLDPLALWENCTDVQGVYYPALLPREHSHRRARAARPSPIFATRPRRIGGHG